MRLLHLAGVQATGLLEPATPMESVEPMAGVTGVLEPMVGATGVPEVLADGVD